ncbi:FKBP-type peptidyl-prolyl cis-trans isomerase [Agarilytica rhodophyticola]|uniref:FKBP-type peptidyl-prolyl cis-trans isomerase n=1 Tax=Agarilytica rhodophyticola TaxID=1737490 RepID=UPI000B3489AD|nr:FKBP-type peptidyl-prolyl cis-trans isomerase [Agarilytica rhodophyticola]
MYKETILKHQSTLKLVTLIATGALLAACNQPAEQAKKEEPINLEDSDTKVAYAIGVSAGKNMSSNIANLDGTGIVIDKKTLARAYVDGLEDSSKLDDESLQTVMNEFRERVNTAMQEKRKIEQEEQAKIAEENKTKGAAFLDENKAKEGIVALESGLQYKVVTEGKGKSPAATDRVKVHYKGTLIDGTQFDSSYDRGEPATFGVGQVIKGWTEALQLMKEGAKWQLFIPAELAYGAVSRPQIPGNSVLLFDVELLEVVAEPEKAEPKKAASKKSPH